MWLKTELSKLTVLSFCDPNAETCVSNDVSSYGLSGVLPQRLDAVWKSIAYALMH